MYHFGLVTHNSEEITKKYCCNTFTKKKLKKIMNFCKHNDLTEKTPLNEDNSMPEYGIVLEVH